MAALKRGEFTTSGSTTVDQWFLQWKDTYKAPSGITPKSLGLYDEKYNGYIGPAIGGMQLKDVRDLHLQTILNTQAGMSYSHVSKLRMVMQELFRQARRSRLIIYDPAEGLLLPESVKRSHRPITKEERKHILAVAQTHPSGLWVLTILYTGLRPGKPPPCSGRTSTSTETRSTSTRLWRAAHGPSRPLRLPAGVRDIPMRQELRDRLLEACGDPTAPVFPSANGGVRSANSLRRLWNSFAQALDLHMGAKVRGGEIVQHAIAPRSHPLLPPPHLLHRPAAGWGPYQRGKGAHGTRQYFRHRQYLYPPGSEGAA